MVPIWMLRTAEPGRASSVPLNDLNPSSIYGCSVMNVIRKLIERAGSGGDVGALVSWNTELAENSTDRTGVPFLEPTERCRERRSPPSRRSKGPLKWSAAAPPRGRDATPILETYVSRALRAQHDLDVDTVGHLDPHQLPQGSFVRVEVDEPLVDPHL